MTKPQKPPRELQIGDRVTLKMQYGPFMPGSAAIVREFRNSNDGPQAYIDIGDSGLVVFTSDLARDEY